MALPRGESTISGYKHKYSYRKTFSLAFLLTGVRELGFLVTRFSKVKKTKATKKSKLEIFRISSNFEGILIYDYSSINFNENNY